MKNDGDLPSYPPLAFVRLSERLRRFFLGASRRFTHPQVLLWESVQQMWLAAGLGVAARLGIADLLKDRAMPVSELARLCHVHEASLYRLLRMLASQGFFKEGKNRIFSTTRLARPLQDDQIRFLVMAHLNRTHFQLFGDLFEAVKSGMALDTGEDARSLFDRIGGKEQSNELFNKAMSDASRMQIPALLPAFPFAHYPCIIDVGGGQGHFLAAILNEHPGSKGILFDLPQALKQCRELPHMHGLDQRLELCEGDFFEGLPAGGDLYMLKSVLHDWDDDQALGILKQLHVVMEKEARLLVIESVLDEGNTPSIGKMTDILMLVAVGGRERTRREFQALFTEAGFELMDVHPTVSPHSLIEARKI